MRVLLSNSPLQYFHSTCFYHPDWGALNIAQLAAMVGQDHEVKLVDNWHYLFRSEGVRGEIKKFEPHLFGISNSTAGDTDRVLELGREIRKKYPKLIMVAGGQAASVRAKDFLDDGFDFVVRGEGEYTFKELVNAIDHNQGDLSNIDGLAFKKNGQVHFTNPRQRIKSLDELPYPSRKLQPRLKSKFFPGMYSSEIETSRGCPFECDFCAITAYWERSYRKKSTDKLFQELCHIKYEIGCDQIYFIDDTFGLRVKEYCELFERMIKEKLNIKWFTQIRPDTIANNPEMIRMAKAAGFFGALVGFDSYNDDVLDGVDKIGSAQINQRASEIFRKNEIVIFGVHIFGLPHESPRKYYKTFKEGRKNSDVYRMSFLSLIPGTPLYDHYFSQGKVIAYGKKQKVPYSHGIQTEERNPHEYLRWYFFYWVWHTFSPWTLWDMLMSRGLYRLMKWRAYVTAFRYCFYLGMRKLGWRLV